MTRVRLLPSCLWQKEMGILWDILSETLSCPRCLPWSSGSCDLSEGTCWVCTPKDAVIIKEKQPDTVSQQETLTVTDTECRNSQGFGMIWDDLGWFGIHVEKLCFSCCCCSMGAVFKTTLGGCRRAGTRPPGSQDSMGNPGRFRSFFTDPWISVDEMTGISWDQLHQTSLRQVPWPLGALFATFPLRFPTQWLCGYLSSGLKNPCSIDGWFYNLNTGFNNIWEIFSTFHNTMAPPESIRYCNAKYL